MFQTTPDDARCRSSILPTNRWFRKQWRPFRGCMRCPSTRMKLRSSESHNTVGRSTSCLSNAVPMVQASLLPTFQQYHKNSIISHSRCRAQTILSPLVAPPAVWCAVTRRTASVNTLTVASNIDHVGDFRFQWGDAEDDSYGWSGWSHGH